MFRRLFHNGLSAIKEYWEGIKFLYKLSDFMLNRKPGPVPGTARLVEKKAWFVTHAGNELRAEVIEVRTHPQDPSQQMVILRRGRNGKPFCRKVLELHEDPRALFYVLVHSLEKFNCSDRDSA